MSDPVPGGDWGPPQHPDVPAGPPPQHAASAHDAPAAQHAPATPQAPAAQHAPATPEAPAAQHAGTAPEPPAAQHAPSTASRPARRRPGRSVERVAKQGRRTVRLVAGGGAAAALAAIAIVVATRKDDPPSARPLPPATASSDASSGSPAPSGGDTLAGTVTPQASTTIPFHADAGTVSYFAAAPGCVGTDLQWVVEDANGVPLSGAAVICGDVGRVDFTTTGSYRIRVYSTGTGDGSGDQSFRVLRKASRPDRISTLTVDRPVSGTIDLPGARDVYEFDASAGEIGYFASPDCSTDELQWNVETIDGSPIGAASVICGDVGRVDFTATGRYRVRVFSVNGGTGTYDVEWQRSRADHVEAITPGQTVRGTIDLPGAQDLHTFDATAGSSAFFAAAEGCTNNDRYWVVEDSTGAPVSGTAVICGDLGEVTFATTGSYRVRVYSVGGGVGPYEFTWSAAGGPGS